ncbi:MAG: hypothetical protein M3R27_09790 [Bacteroidota bacterium]|nr:hypothetical protein [Bacteroidota bacterium]
MKKAILLPTLVFLLAFFACRKELEKPSWDTQILAPLINASLDINNLLPDSILQANADSSLKIVYNSDIFKLTIDSLFSIPDTILSNFYTVPFGFTITGGSTIISNTSETTYQLQGVELRKVIVKSGFVKYTVKSKVQEVTQFVYTLPCAKLGGVPFTFTATVPAGSASSPGVYSQVFDLSGYTIDLTGPLNNKVNTIYNSLVVSNAGASVFVSPSDSIKIENTFFDIIPSYAKGYFGQNTIDIGPELTDFSLFSRITDGTIQLEDVNLNLKLENPIGLDARVYFNNLSSVNTRSGTTINLSNSIIGSPININRASESGGTVYPTYSNFPLTVSNSNIKPMIENLPDKFGYSMQLITNPLGNISGSNDFIYADRLFKARLEMEIPLSLVATNLTLTDTLDFNISSGDAQNVHSGTITLFANNGFPFDAGLQMYTLDENNVITDSIFGYANTIDEAPVNASLRAIGKKLTKISIPLSESKMSMLYSTKKIVLKVKFNTSSQPQYIKIYSDYTIDVKLVGDFNYTIHLK